MNMTQPQVFTMNPLEDVFPDTPSNGRASYALHMARGEGEGFLVAVRAGDAPLAGLSAWVRCDAPGVEWAAWHVGLVPFSKNTIHIGSRSIRAAAPGVLPEYFQKQPRVDVPAGETRSLYIAARTAPDAPPGVYEGTVELEAEGFRAAVSFTLTIYAVTLPAPRESRLTYVCWTQLLVPENAREVYGIEPWSEDYWTYVKNCAVLLRRQRQNMINIELEHTLDYRLSADENGRLRFDFTRFDRFVDIMLDERYMGAKALCGMHLAARDWMLDPSPGTGWNQRPLIAWVFERQEDGSFRRVWKPASDPAVEAFHHQLFAALAAHLREKGWSRIWVQHVADEIDNDIHYQQTLAIYRLFHHYLPEGRTIDAVRRESPYAFGRELDIHVPLLWHHDMAPAAYAALQGEGSEVWQYTCLQPQFEYLSRLGDYPLSSTRLLGWYNFRHGLTGFLHYAWNNYGPCVKRWDPYADACCFGSFPCDAFIVYPDREGLTVLESVRSEAQRDGFEDYELLCLAAEKAPDTVRRLAQLMVTAADDAVRNPEFLLALRVRLLQIAAS